MECIVATFTKTCCSKENISWFIRNEHSVGVFDTYHPTHAISLRCRNGIVLYSTEFHRLQNIVVTDNTRDQTLFFLYIVPVSSKKQQQE